MLNVRLYGDTAIVNGSVIAADDNGELERTMFTDVFVYRDGRWQAVNARRIGQAKHQLNEAGPRQLQHRDASL
jgi:hypothetical protein